MTVAATCIVEGCGREWKVQSRMLCSPHYQRFMKTGTTDRRPLERDHECQLDGCRRPRHGHGMCGTHLSQIRRNGTTSDAVRVWLPLEERFFASVTKTETCWLFSKMQANGYGYFSAYGKPCPAHRFAYEFLVGPIPEGLHLDHLCRVRNCVKPDHLEPVTPWENTMRSGAISAVNAQKTACIRGHAFSDENTYYSKDGRRYCRECARIRERAYRLQDMKVGS